MSSTSAVTPDVLDIDAERVTEEIVTAMRSLGALLSIATIVGIFLFCQDAFGTEDSQPTMKLPRTQFPKDAKIDKGERFEAKGPTGTPMTLRVIAVDSETVTAQVVHPLAGKDVEFQVKIVSVKPPIPTKPAPPISLEEIEPEPSSRDASK